MIRLLSASFIFVSLSAHADSGTAASVNQWIAAEAGRIADARQGVDGEFVWKRNSEGMIYAGSFATGEKDLCTVSAYRSAETADRLEYTVLLSCRNGEMPSANSFTKLVGSFAL